MLRHFKARAWTENVSLVLAIAGFLIVCWCIFYPPLSFFYHCWQERLPTELWSCLWQRHRHGWNLDLIEPATGPGPRGYLLHFHRRFLFGSHDLGWVFQSEFRWRTPKSRGVWVSKSERWSDTYAWNSPHWIDLTGDEKPELALTRNQHLKHSCCLCDNLVLFSQSGNDLNPIQLHLEGPQAVVGIHDLDADGKPELVVCGAAREGTGESGPHAEGFTYNRVYQWNETSGKFQDVSFRFPEYHRRELDKELKRIDAKYDGKGWREHLFRVSQKLAVTAIYHWSLGELDRGWAEYEQGLAELIETLKRYERRDYVNALLEERKQLSELFFGRELPWPSDATKGGRKVAIQQRSVEQ